MLIKAVTLFLVVLAVLAMFGRLRTRRPPRDRQGSRQGDRRDDLPARPRKCRECGGFIIGKGACGCRER